MTGHLSRLSCARTDDCRSRVYPLEIGIRGCALVNKCTRPSFDIRMYYTPLNRSLILLLYNGDGKLRARYLRQLRNKWSATSFLARVASKEKRISLLRFHVISNPVICEPVCLYVPRVCILVYSFLL